MRKDDNNKDFYQIIAKILATVISDVGKIEDDYPFTKHLGEPVCLSLPFWFSFTGCDSVSMFAERGKILHREYGSLFRGNRAVCQVF